jgi:hypothetical protein
MNRATITRILKLGIIRAAGAVGLLACTCSIVSSEGGGTRGGNPVITGTIVKPDGATVRNARVSLMAADYDPIADAPLPPSSIDTTDERGLFSIVAPDSGRYTVEAVEIQEGGRLLRFNVEVLPDSVLVLPADTLSTPGTVKLPVPEGIDKVDGYVYVPGTSIAVTFGSTDSDTVEFDSVPAGILPVMVYGRRDDVERQVVRYAIPVQSDEVTLIVNPLWSYRQQIVLNTSPSGADVTDDIYNFPVLIRLNDEVFDFTQTRNDGRDLRFTGSDNMSLPIEIERWDAVAGRAEIWVKLDTIFGNDSAQQITMYWGNSAVSSEPAGGMVFDTSDGFQGVWHLSDAANDRVGDATINGYYGVSPDIARPQVGEGVIGNCGAFDGVADYITMPNTANGKVNFPEEGFFTVSAWVNLDTLDGIPHLIVAKGFTQYCLRFTYFPSDSPSWEFSEFSESSRWKACTTSATSRQWTLLTGVREGSRQLLYCNGVLVDSTPNSYPNNNFSRDMSNDLSIGKFLTAVDVQGVVDSSDGFFKGSIDEVRVLNAAQSPDWVRLCYMNQRAEDRLIVFKE